MSGSSNTTAQHTAKVALFEACKVALAGEDVDVSFGFRWPFVSNDWASLTDTDSEVDPKAIAPRRSQDETLTLSVSVGSWRAGDDAATELATSARAFDLLGKIQSHIRENDITLGGTVLWCVPGRSSSAGATTDQDAEFGRLTEIAATFVCAHRITT
ncbi:hypothetical protein QN355_06315 [Cryobacterium sp. 10S3]|uniref:hypothetical protein n=1 Tax=Cryobacterium sp. 10S3 TaxID=3048582 RepID=UPI002AC95CFD|nr:hypothetical protein [Cryobacterium sp. 10S3]MEB0286162.1 hypothetical protein [Cryobacterium sp. 10S3]WPX12220.1 hypothetical protein RHM57_11055 [Cryobacterium sp. 10S3]